jgi:anti-sigma factor RsiW
LTDDDIADWDAAYVLGALNEEDRHRFEAHVAANPQVAESLSELGELVGVLARLTLHQALALI